MFYQAEVSAFELVIAAVFFYAHIAFYGELAFSLSHYGLVKETPFLLVRETGEKDVVFGHSPAHCCNGTVVSGSPGFFAVRLYITIKCAVQAVAVAVIGRISLIFAGILFGLAYEVKRVGGKSYMVYVAYNYVQVSVLGVVEIVHLAAFYDVWFPHFWCIGPPVSDCRKSQFSDPA